MQTDPTKPRNKGGRPQGGISRVAQEAREAAQATGKLPHEILLDLARGMPVKIAKLDPDGEIMWEAEGVPVFTYVVPDLDKIADAAKAAAPYFAPKISTVEVISGVPDNELDRIIAQLAAQAGVDIGPGGEESSGETTEADSSRNGVSRQRVRLLE